MTPSMQQFHTVANGQFFFSLAFGSHSIFGRESSCVLWCNRYFMRWKVLGWYFSWEGFCGWVCVFGRCISCGGCFSRGAGFTGGEGLRDKVHHEVERMFMWSKYCPNNPILLGIVERGEGRKKSWRRDCPKLGGDPKLEEGNRYAGSSVL